MSEIKEKMADQNEETKYFISLDFFPRLEQSLVHLQLRFHYIRG